MPYGKDLEFRIAFCNPCSDCGSNGDYEAKIVLIDGSGIKHELFSKVVNYMDGWYDKTFDITVYAGQTVKIRFEAYAGGYTSDWCSEHAGIDYFYAIYSEPPCSTVVVAPIDPIELESAPAAGVRDPLGDYFLDHPLFEEIFDVVYESNEAIPPAIDIIAVEVALDGDDYSFHILTAGDNLPELLQEGRRSVRFGVYVDTDLNGISDVLLTTTDQPERGVAITPGFEVIEDMLRLSIEDNSVTMCVPRDRVGDHFDWVVFSGYSPVTDAYCSTPLAAVFYVPAVDIAFAGPDRRVGFSDSFSQSNPACKQVWTGVTSCPPKGNPPGRTNIGPGLDGWLIKREQCGNRAVDWWCYDSQWNSLQNRWEGGAFGKRVFENTYKGWIAKCPFDCGLNDNKVLRDSSNTKIIKVYHTIKDADCPQPAGPPIPKDKDRDLRRDIMSHEYQFATNTVISCNIERDPQTNALLDKRCLSPKPPYTSPWSVPGSIP